MTQANFQQKYHQMLQIEDARKDLLKRIEQGGLDIDVWVSDWESQDGYSLEQAFYWYEMKALQTIGIDEDLLELLFEKEEFTIKLQPGSSGEWSPMMTFTITPDLLTKYLQPGKASDAGQLGLFEIPGSRKDSQAG